MSSLQYIITTLKLAMLKEPFDYPRWSNFEYDDKFLELLLQKLEDSNRFSDSDILAIIEAYEATHRLQLVKSQ